LDIPLELEWIGASQYHLHMQGTTERSLCQFVSLAGVDFGGKCLVIVTLWNKVKPGRRRQGKNVTINGVLNMPSFLMTVPGLTTMLVLVPLP